MLHLLPRKEAIFYYFIFSPVGGRGEGEARSSVLLPFSLALPEGGELAACL